MRRFVPQLSFILPLVILMIGIVTVMPVAASTSCGVAWDAARAQPDTSVHFDANGKRAIVDPCQERSAPEQNRTIVNFALPLGIGLIAPFAQLAFGPAQLLDMIVRPGAPPGYISTVLSPPPVL
jgi:hypothetical protein